MQSRPGAVLLFVFVILASACTGSPSNTGAPTTSGSAPPAAPTRTAVFLTHVEPISLSEHRALYTTGSNPVDAKRLFNASLTLSDFQGVAQPYLAERKPELNTDTWRVFPDGTMETVYTLRPGLTWHDGTPFTTEDMVLSWRMSKNPDFGVAGLVPMKWVEEVVPQDARTLVVRWNSTYPMADTFNGRDWAPLPSHILKNAFESQSPQAFLNLPYWTHEFVGLGPYRVERRDPGSFIEGVAFAGHALGRPKIERIQVRFAGDPNAALSSLLAGEAHMTLDNTIGFEQGAFLKREWAQRNAGTVLLSPNNLRYVQIQFKLEYVSPREIMDVRVRKALAHAIDKQALLDAVQGGEGQVAEAMLPPLVEYSDAALRSATKYPYEPRQTARILEEAGFARARDGLYALGGETFRPELRASASDQNAREQAIIADGWRRAGIDVQSRLLSEVEQNDRELRSTYPAFATADTVNLEERTVYVKLYGPNGATPANRWSGSNRGGWQDPRFDQLYDELTTNLDRAARNAAIVQAVKLVSEEVPLYPLYYNYDVRAHAAALRGPQAYAPSGEATWAVETWVMN
jgi:peptide/nickel transport system substrate-binding protein